MRSTPRRLIVIVALATLAALVAAACSGGGSSKEAQTSLYDGPVVNARPNALGLKWNWAQIDQLAPDLASVAGGSTFFELVWCDVEPEEGHRDWSRVDDVARSSARLGYRLLLKLRVGSCWATGDRPPADDGKLVSRPPLDLDAYAAFMEAAVERYSSVGVHSYAIENEVNSRTSWDGTPDEYEALVRHAVPAIRSADPGATIVDSGISSIGYGVSIAAGELADGDDDGAVDFYRGFYSRRFAASSFVFPDVDGTDELRAVLDGAAAVRAQQYLDVTSRMARDGLFDAWQLHFYERPQDLAAVLDHVRADLGVTLPVQAWEVGIAWAGDDFDADTHAADTAELLDAAIDAGLAPIIYLPAAFTPGGRRDDELWRGLWLPDGTARPAAAAFKAAVQRTTAH